MEKPVKANQTVIPRPLPKPEWSERKSATLADIRRQLGWGLMESARRGALR